MKYLVRPTSCLGEAEFRTRLKLILHNNACAVIRDTKMKNRAETLTRCVTARVINVLLRCRCHVFFARHNLVHNFRAACRLNNFEPGNVEGNYAIMNEFDDEKVLLWASYMKQPASGQENFSEYSFAVVLPLGERAIR